MYHNKTEKILNRALAGEAISFPDGLFLYQNALTNELILIANEIRKQKADPNSVGWIIDRNINITNVCISGCKFCNFHCRPGSEGTYVTDIQSYIDKIATLFERGGNQILLQGGLNPKLRLKFYVDLFKTLKSEFPDLKLHALGPPEIHYLAKLDSKAYTEVLVDLIDAGLDSLPGAGAEILSDRVRRQISPGKCTSRQWLDVMREAHKLNLPTSATMMFGHIETMSERIEHLCKLREVQDEKPEKSYGFVTFVPWPFQDENTVLRNEFDIRNNVTAKDYIRLIAISRIMLNSVKNIQASWLTIGKETGKLALHAGANDLGSVMIEENVVSSAGATNSMDAKTIQKVILDAGFKPRYRNQKYETENLPESVINLGNGKKYINFRKFS